MFKVVYCDKVVELYNWSELPEEAKKSAMLSEWEDLLYTEQQDAGKNGANNKIITDEIYNILVDAFYSFYITNIYPIGQNGQISRLNFSIDIKSSLLSMLTDADDKYLIDKYNLDIPYIGAAKEREAFGDIEYTISSIGGIFQIFMKNVPDGLFDKPNMQDFLEEYMKLVQENHPIFDDIYKKFLISYQKYLNNWLNDQVKDWEAYTYNSYDDFKNDGEIMWDITGKEYNGYGYDIEHMKPYEGA